MPIQQPEINLAAFATQLSKICPCGWRPQLLSGFFRLWLTEHFCLADRIEDCDLKHRVWSPGASTNILIEMSTRWRPQTTEKRPAVIIKRNGIKVLRQIIGDRIMGLGEEAGRYAYASWLLGSHTIFCVAGESAEAELLGAEVYRELLQFTPVLRGPLSFQRLLVTEIGAVGLLEEASENFAVPVTIGWIYEDDWEIVPQVPTIKKIDLTMFRV